MSQTITLSQTELDALVAAATEQALASMTAPAAPVSVEAIKAIMTPAAPVKSGITLIEVAVGTVVIGGVAAAGYAAWNYFTGE